MHLALILDDPPCGAERTDNGLRLGLAFARTPVGAITRAYVERRGLPEPARLHALPRDRATTR